MATNGESVDIEVKKVVKKVKKEKKVVETHNGDAEAEVTLKIAPKKSAGKTETSVDVQTKVLPDGSTEEKTITTTKTTIDGKTEIATKTATKITPPEPKVLEQDEEKDAGKTETSVDVKKKVLPDGSIEEKTITTTKTTINGRTEIATKTATKITPPEPKAVKEVEETPIKDGGKTETSVDVQTKVLPDGSVEEKTITTTKTTIDGRTEIATKTATKITPPEPKVEEEETEEEEEEEEVVEEAKPVSKSELPKENGINDTIVKNEESSEVITRKKVVVQKQETEEEEEEVEEEEVKEDHVKVQVNQEPTKVEVKEEDEEEEEEEEEDEVDEIVEEKQKTEDTKKHVTTEEHKVSEDEEEEDEVVISKTPPSEVKKIEVKEESEEDEEEEEVEEEEVEVKQHIQTVAQPKEEDKKEEVAEQSEEEEEEEEVEKEECFKEAPKQPEPVQKPETKPEGTSRPSEPVREIPILKPVESIEIKPIPPAGETITRSHTESSEIKVTNRPDVVTTQTELHRMENIVTINRTTKALDQQYEQITQHGVPTVKTYFAPSRDRISISPSRPYEPQFHPEPQPERRHSLLLERLSMERQAPPVDSYQYTNKGFEPQRQWSQEPQSEIVNASNVKPSTITNQQWYQQRDNGNVIYNNVQAPAQPETQSQPTQWSQPQPQTLPSQWSQPQSSYTDNVTQDYSKTSTNTYQQNYSAPIPKPNTWSSNNLGQLDSIPSINSQSNQYSYTSKDTTQSYQKSTQYSSSYVPPPWEQDSGYVPPPIQNTNQNYYQPPTNTFTPDDGAWKSTLPAAKFTKPPPTAYQPPAPNQSFVKPVNVMEPPKIPGRKTYYSEYERRYISVPETTYVPGDAKYQPQPDPSPQYYYDNNEPKENVEPEWRKELREFTEKTQTEQTKQTHYKTQQSSQTEQIQQTYTAQPPWESNAKYEKAPTVPCTPTPSWSQTLRPQSWRERSFDSEYVGSHNLKTNTIGRGRPLSSYVNSKVNSIPERPRGVSVDRYNPNSYQPPATSLLPPGEHPPPAVQTLSPTPPGKTNYHNPNVPAYHARSAADHREQNVVSQQQTRVWGNEARDSPIQSRSFKYLQWITGTDE